MQDPQKCPHYLLFKIVKTKMISEQFSNALGTVMTPHIAQQSKQTKKSKQLCANFLATNLINLPKANVPFATLDCAQRCFLWPGQFPMMKWHKNAYPHQDDGFKPASETSLKVAKEERKHKWLKRNTQFG